MNARHDSHDFFQRFVPQGECVSVLFLQFRRQIYLHIIPFGQKRANLIQRPVFKYNLIACPRDSQLDISFFYLKPSVTLVESTDFSRMQKKARSIPVWKMLFRYGTREKQTGQLS